MPNVHLTSPLGCHTGLSKPCSSPTPDPCAQAWPPSGSFSPSIQAPKPAGSRSGFSASSPPQSLHCPPAPANHQVWLFDPFHSSHMGFPQSSVSKESACNAGDPGSIPRLGRSPGEGKGNPLQHSCLENPMDRGAWRATAHRMANSQTQLKQQHAHTRRSLGNDRMDHQKPGIWGCSIFPPLPKDWPALLQRYHSLLATPGAVCLV